VSHTVSNDSHIRLLVPLILCHAVSSPCAVYFSLPVPLVLRRSWPPVRSGPRHNAPRLACRLRLVLCGPDDRPQRRWKHQQRGVQCGSHACRSSTGGVQAQVHRAEPRSGRHKGRPVKHSGTHAVSFALLPVPQVLPKYVVHFSFNPAEDEMAVMCDVCERDDVRMRPRCVCDMLKSNGFTIVRAACRSGRFALRPVPGKPL